MNSAIHPWLPVRDLERELHDAGFTQRRIRGSHRSYKNTQTGYRITFSPCRERHGGSRHGLVHPLAVLRVRRELAACKAR